MQLTKIYENQLLIGNLADAESLTLTSSLDYAKTLDEKGPVVTSDKMPLQDLFKFYRESFPAMKLTVATNENAEALEALESGVSVLFDGGDRIDVRGKDGKQIALARLRFATIDNIVEYSRKAIRELLSDYPFVREPEAVTAVCGASPLADPAMLTGYAEWIIRTTSERIIRTVEIVEKSKKIRRIGLSACNSKKSILSRGSYDYDYSKNSESKAVMRELNRSKFQPASVNAINLKVQSTSVFSETQKKQVCELSQKLSSELNHCAFRRVGSDDNSKLVSQILSGGNFIHKGSQGSGKSELARDLVRSVTRNERHKVVIITHRRSIADSCMSGVPGVVHYESVEPGAELNMRALVICVNSIIRPNLAEFLKNVEVVIVEEAAQTLRHIASGTVDRRPEVLFKLNGLIANAHANLLLDADANSRVVRLIRDNKPAGAVVNILEKPMDLSKITIEFNRYKQAEGMIKGMLESGPVAIATDSKRKVEKLKGKIRKEFPDFKEKNVKRKGVEKKLPAKRKLLSVHSDNILGNAQSDFIKAPNAHVKNIDALIYSPAITSCLSITEERFENHVGLFSGITTAQDDIQMLRRNRPCERFTVGIRSAGRYLPDTAEQLLSGASNITDFDRWSAEIEADDNFIRNHIQAAMYIIAKHHGFNVVIASEDKRLIDIGDNWELGGRIIEGFDAKKKLLNAHPAGSLSVEKRTENGGETNENTAWSIERARLERTVCKSEIDSDDIKAWGRGVLAAHIANLEILRSDEANADRLDKKDTKMTAFRDKRRFVEHRNVFRMIFGGLGLDPFNGSGEYTVAEANTLLAKLQDNRSRFNSLRLETEVGKAEIKMGTRTVNKLLSEFGFEVVSKGSSDKNDRQRKYSICPKSWKRMNEYLSNRLERNMALVKPEQTEDEKSKINSTPIEVKPISQEELYGKVAEMSVESRVSIKHDAWKKAQDFFKPVALQGINSLEAVVSLGTDATSLSDSISSKFFEGRKITFRQSEITKVDALGTVYATLFELPEAAKQQLAKDISGQYEEDQLIPF